MRWLALLVLASCAHAAREWQTHGACVERCETVFRRSCTAMRDGDDCICAIGAHSVRINAAQVVTPTGPCEWHDYTKGETQ